MELKNKSDIIKDILEGMKDSKTPYEVVENRKEAIAWAMKNAKKDDIIQRITGYLVGTTSRWNKGKLAELHDRVTHATSNK